MDRAEQKRRRLNFEKCRFCRASKKKCEREGEWPSRCKLCIESDLPCSKDERASGAPLPRQGPAHNDDLEKQYELALKIAWLKRLRLYAKSSQAVRDSWEALFGRSPAPQALERLTRRFRLGQHTLAEEITTCLRSLPSSISPLLALSCSFLLSTDEASRSGLGLGHGCQQADLLTPDVVHRARDVGDHGMALIVQELRLADILCSEEPNEEEVAIELGRYYDVHRECARRWQATFGFEVAGMPPLHSLLLLTGGKGFRLLISGPACLIEAEDMLGRSLFHLALDHGVGEEAALRLAGKSIATKDILGRSLLHLACSKGCGSLVSFLVEHKADTGGADCHGRQALHYASASGQDKVVQLLLGHGAEVGSTDHNGCTPLALAAKKGNWTTASLLRGDATAESIEDLCRESLLECGSILGWPCVSHMLKDLLTREGIEDPKEFPIRWEEERCSFRDAGRQDGQDAAPRTQNPRSLQEPIYSPETFGFLESGTPIPGSSLGYNGVFPPAGITQHLPPGPHAHEVGQGTSCPYTPAVGEAGIPGFGEHEVWMHVESFQENIHMIHPIILPKALHDMVRVFLDGIRRPSTGFADVNGLDHGRPTATAHSAAVLAMLALGKLSGHRAPLPDAVLESDTLPGSGYLAMAREIIGTQLSGDTLEHVYAELFTGMYYGQVGRVVQSHTHISQGCTTLMNIMRPCLARLSKNDPDEMSLQDTRIVFAYWTALQLESDILIDIPRRESRITGQKHMIHYPSIGAWALSRTKEDSSTGPWADRVFWAYCTQIFLSRYSGRVAAQMPQMRNVETMLSLIYALHPTIMSRAHIPRQFAFYEDDPPAPDMLSALIRGRHWSALGATFRPCIKLVLHVSFRLRRSEAGPAGRMATTYEELRPTTIQRVESLPLEVWDNARKGICALIESTRSLHGLGDRRPVLTNAFGTAHAQWGNLVILAACYRDPFLCREMDGRALRDLFMGTFEFLRLVPTAPGSALSVDRRLLEGIYQALFDSPCPTGTIPSTSGI